MVIKICMLLVHITYLISPSAVCGLWLWLLADGGNSSGVCVVFCAKWSPNDAFARSNGQRAPSGRLGEWPVGFQVGDKNMISYRSHPIVIASPPPPRKRLELALWFYRACWFIPFPAGVVACGFDWVLEFGLSLFSTAMLALRSKQQDEMLYLELSHFSNQNKSQQCWMQGVTTEDAHAAAEAGV